MIPLDAPAARLEPLAHLVADALVQHRVADDAALADFLAADLELRLDQRDQRAARFGEDQRNLEHLGEADERSVAHHPVAGPVDLLRGERTGVGLLEHGDARILPQFPGELVGADVDREDMRCTVREQDFGEAAGRAADVHRHRASGVEPEVLDRMRQLDPAAPDPRMIAAPDLDRGVLGDLLAGLVDLALGDEHQAGHDQRLRARAALGKAAGHKQVIDALFRHASSA